MKRIRNGKRDPGWSEGVVTVFFTLLGAIMIGFLFALLESARMEGARTQAVCLSDMANFSVFGEFERKVLKDFDVFVLDGAAGSGEFNIGRVEERLKHYLELNAKPNEEGLAQLCFDPWQICLSGSKVQKYALLTDNGCENFYQQAVGYMHETAWMGMTAELLSLYHQADEVTKKQDDLEKEKEEADRQLTQVDQKEEEKKKELEQQEEQSAESGDGQLLPAVTGEEQPKPENPLSTLRRLKNKDLLEIVCPGMEISENRVYSKDFCSQRAKKKGNMKTKTPYGGTVDDLLFKEYLLSRFSCFTEPGKAKLCYELEYILSGKHGDRNNLKSTLKSLLAFRESVNYVYLCGDSAKSSQASTLAELLIGWLGMPGITAILKHGIMLGWAYGESLKDVRILTGGGRVPLKKDASSWQLSLENLSKLDTWLEEISSAKTSGSTESGSGLNYREHLRLLLYVSPIGQVKKRAVDMMEFGIREDKRLEAFRADHCLVAMQTETQWSIPPHFSRVTQVFLHLLGKETDLKTAGGFAYN